MLLRQSAASRGSSTAAAAQQRPRSHERCHHAMARAGRAAARGGRARGAAGARVCLSSLRAAWMIEQILGLSIAVQQPTARPGGAPRLGWPGRCPAAPPMACPRHVAPPHPAVLAHVSRGASRFSCARPARGGAHVGKA
jgi:hypothetical protein